MATSDTDPKSSGAKGDADASPFAAFGEYLRGQRQSARLSLRQLAEMARVSNPYLSQIERGLHQPSITVVKSLADALNVSAEALLRQAAGLAGEPAPSQTELAIRSDGRLRDADKETLLSVYRSLVDRTTPAAPVEDVPVPAAAVKRAPVKRSPVKKTVAKKDVAKKAPGGPAQPLP